MTEPTINPVIKNGYDNWIECLEIRGNKDQILADPLNAWTEAFETGTLFERLGTVHVIHGFLRDVTDVGQLALVERIMRAIEKKGMSRA